MRKGILSAVIAGILVAGVFTTVYVGSDGFKKSDLSTWFKTAPIEQTQPEQPEISETENNVVITPDAQMSVRMLDRSEYASNGVSEDTYGAYTLSVTIVPSYASIKTATWSLAWFDPDSDWVIDKEVTDYVTLSVAQGESTIVSCMEPFGEKIRVTAVADGNTLVSAFCIIDFMAKPCDFGFRVKDGDDFCDLPYDYTVSMGDILTVSFYCDSTVGTILPDYDVNTLYSIRICATDELISALNTAGLETAPTLSPPGLYDVSTGEYEIQFAEHVVSRLILSDLILSGSFHSNDFFPILSECLETTEQHFMLMLFDSSSNVVFTQCIKLNLPPSSMSLNVSSITF